MKLKNNWTTSKTNWDRAKSMKSKVKSRNYEDLSVMTTLMPQLFEKNGKKCRTLLWKHSVKPTKRTQLPTLMEVNNLQRRRTKNKRRNNNLILDFCRILKKKLLINLNLSLY